MKPEHKLTLSMLGLQKNQAVDRRYRDPYDELKPKPVVDPRPKMPTIEKDGIIFRGEGMKPKRKPLKFKL